MVAFSPGEQAYVMTINAQNRSMRDEPTSASGGAHASHEPIDSARRMVKDDYNAFLTARADLISDAMKRIRAGGA
jgi:hypothetical protein